LIRLSPPTTCTHLEFGTVTLSGGGPDGGSIFTYSIPKVF
jgi:hypothetical protein